MAFASRALQREANTKYRATPTGRATTLLQNAKERAALKGLEFELDIPWIAERLSAGVCEVTGLPLDVRPSGGRTARAFGASLDRTDSLLGYTKANTKVVCWLYNRAKGVNDHADVMKMAEALCSRQ